MGSALVVVAIVLGVVAVVGSVLPGLPGPPLGWIGLLAMYHWGGTNADGDPMTGRFLLFWLLVTTLVSVVDYVVPAWFTKATGGSRYAGWGAIAGLFVGMLVPPVGMILGSLLGAFLAELLLGGKDAAGSAQSALGAFLGFLFGTGLKVIASGLMLYYIIVYI